MLNEEKLYEIVGRVVREIEEADAHYVMPYASYISTKDGIESPYLSFDIVMLTTDGKSIKGGVGVTAVDLEDYSVNETSVFFSVIKARIVATMIMLDNEREQLGVEYCECPRKDIRRPWGTILSQ